MFDVQTHKSRLSAKSSTSSWNEGFSKLFSENNNGIGRFLARNLAPSQSGGRSLTDWQESSSRRCRLLILFYFLVRAPFRRNLTPKPLTSHFLGVRGNNQKKEKIIISNGITFLKSLNGGTEKRERKVWMRASDSRTHSL